jgi:hypothetical protein
MNDFFRRLQADREIDIQFWKKHPELRKQLVDDAYPDEAHFVYELLQNAEDADASTVEFELFDSHLMLTHDGTRLFSERDVEAITDVSKTGKSDGRETIGRFGIGFKSVFKYTESPQIFSGEFSFEIVDFVFPKPIAPRADQRGKTIFIFPFNSSKKAASEAYAEIRTGLDQLAETTLLFLNNLKCISWKAGDQSGMVLRDEHSEVHVEVFKVTDDKEVVRSHWLRFAAPVQNVDKFTAPIDGVERQKVAVAFELAFVGDTASFDGKKPLAKQLKIVPALRGKVAVFFPAEKETSGLRFHVHAPFIPELSRASIKSSPENLPLFEQLAVVAARSLHEIKALGLLTSEFLGALPNNDDALPERYALIRKAVLDEMRAESLVPTYGGGYAPAARLCQARASLKALLSSEDLAFVTGRNDQPEWSIGATQKSSNQDRLLASLSIQSWDADKLKTFFEAKARKKNSMWDQCELNQNVITWLGTKPNDWLQSLYSLLYKHCEDQDDYGDLKYVYFLRLASQKWDIGFSAFFQTGPFSADDPLHRVDDRILTEGTKKAQQQDARRFLERLGVREPNENDELDMLLRARYGEKSIPPSDEDYLTDLKRMAFLEKNPSQKNAFTSYRIFKVTAHTSQWAKSSSVFLDKPFAPTGLNSLYTVVVDTKHKRWPLDPWYETCGVHIEKLVHFAESIGCQNEFKDFHTPSDCSLNPAWSYLKTAPGSRMGNFVSRDFALAPAAKLLLKTQQVEAALLFWKALCRSEPAHPTILQACYQLTDKGGPRVSDSLLVYELKNIAWVPQTDGSFVRPSAAIASKMPDGFAVDTGNKWMKAVEFGTDDKKRETESATRVEQRELFGFSSEEELNDGLAFAKLPKSERERFLTNAWQVKSDPVELPERPVRNADLRSERVGDQAKATPEKSSVIKPRSVQLGAEAAKLEAKLYLADQYTNTNGQMICQACKGELPFKLPNGSYYFEAVEIIRGAPKRFREGFLALCPNHAAAYQHANAQCNSMYDVIAAATGNEVELALGDIETTVYFTQMHLADAKVCLASIEDDEP